MALAVVAATVLALRVTDTLAATDSTLQVMGFDPDRARLIADLIGAAIATAAGTLATGAALAAGLAGLIGGLSLFAHTFVNETEAALRSKGPAGWFDPTGWLLSLITLVVAFAIVAWATAELSRVVRGWCVAVGRDAVGLMRGGRNRGQIVRPAGAIAVATLLAVAIPMFGDMVNYSPDAHMRGGAQNLVGLTTGGDPGPSAGAPAPSGSTGEGTQITAPSTVPGAGGYTGPVTKRGTPWAAWKPTGPSQLVPVSMPPPWTGGDSTAKIDIYLPPGYASSNRTYPVIYAVPWGSTLWDIGTNLPAMLDSMITSGSFPASIVVFVSQNGGPYPNSECANSLDGKEWFETYITKTVVPYIDTNYRTIQKAAARSVMGFSQGGFCSAMLVLRHPNVFATAIAMSGYYQGGVVSIETPNAPRAFGGNSALEASYSPLRLVSTLSPAERARVFLILEGDPSDPFYGSQYEQMISAAHAAGIALAEVPSSSGHGWPAVRDHLPLELQLLGQRQTALGVFS